MTLTPTIIPTRPTMTTATVEPVERASDATTDVFLDRIPHEFSRRHLILCARSPSSHTSEAASTDAVRASDAESSDDPVLLVASRTKPWIIHNVRVALGHDVPTRIRLDETLAAAIDAAYADHERRRANQPTGDEAGGPDLDGVGAPRVTVTGSSDVEADLREALASSAVGGMGGVGVGGDSDLLDTSGKAPAVRLVDLILFEALLKNASDVHLQPTRGGALVRYRLDGVLHTVRELPRSVAASVTSRIKVMSRLDVAEQRAPQDGRASVTIGTPASSATSSATSSMANAGRRVDLRVSVLPSTYGERVVLRLLDPARSSYLLNFGGLGMPAAIEKRYLAQVSRASGIVLATGPTGSGKTTTLYTTLAWLSSTNAGGLARGCELNMMTIEDPVEYDLNSGSSSQPQTRGGVARASGGAGGGLAISQTQVDAKKNVTFAAGLRHILRQDPDVIMVGEIRDAETARIAVQASLTGHLVLSTLHTNDAASAVARLIDLSVEPFLVASSLSAVLAQRLVRLMHQPCDGAGCEGCSGTGFKGRTALFELLVLDAVLRDLVTERTPAMEIKAKAQSKGMTTLQQAGEALVQAGRSTREEIARVIEGMGDEATEDVGSGGRAEGGGGVA